VTSLEDPKWKDACAHIGEIILLSTALDYQLTEVVIEVMHLEHSPMLETVVATLDSRQKIEMIKARARKLSNKDWRKALLDYVDKIEKTARVRNAAAHTALFPTKNANGFEFAPAQASKILKSMKITGREYALERVTLDDVKAAVPVAEQALGDGITVLENFSKLRAAKEILTMSED
jgi:hypothetical protein